MKKCNNAPKILNGSHAFSLDGICINCGALARPQVTITFPSQEIADIWWRYYLDGGGDSGFDVSLENDDLDYKDADINSKHDSNRRIDYR